MTQKQLKLHWGFPSPQTWLDDNSDWNFSWSKYFLEAASHNGSFIKKFKRILKIIVIIIVIVIAIIIAITSFCSV